MVNGDRLNLDISPPFDGETSKGGLKDIPSNDVLDQGLQAETSTGVQSFNFLLDMEACEGKVTMATVTSKPRSQLPDDPFHGCHGVEAETIVAAELVEKPMLALDKGPDGWSLVVREPIGEATVVFDITGEHFTSPSKYSIQVGENLHLGGDEVHAVDFTDHSCHPNCRLDVQGNQVHLVSVRRIDAGEKLTFNYLTTEWDMAEPFECKCAAEGCFKHIAGFRYLSVSQRIELYQLLTPFLKGKVNKTRG